MPLHHKLLILIYPFIYLNELFKNYLDPITENKIRVLLYHDVSINNFGCLLKSLTELKKKWNFITPQDFENHINGKRILKGKNLLLTFDDGFISNKFVAKKILNLLDIKAIFFVLPNFININEPDIARKYVAENIYPSLSIQNIPMHWTNMNWNDLNELISDGHTIGAHTMSHPVLSKINDIKILENEIIESAEILQKKLNIQIKHFAFPFGNINSFSTQALNVVKERFEFCHSGLRGNNYENVSQFDIRRDSLNANDHILLIKSFLLGAADFQYKKSIEILKSWSNHEYNL